MLHSCCLPVMWTCRTWSPAWCLETTPGRSGFSHSTASTTAERSAERYIFFMHIVFSNYWFSMSSNACRLYMCALQDMSSLIHSMYEALDASIKRPYGGATALKIRLVLTPCAGPHKISQTGDRTFFFWDNLRTLTVAKGFWTVCLYHLCGNDLHLSSSAGAEKKSGSQETGSPVRRVYCVDENIERRNHYMELAGVENYTSKFDNKGMWTPPLFLLLLLFFTMNKCNWIIFGPFVSRILLTGVQAGCSLNSSAAPCGG